MSVFTLFASNNLYQEKYNERWNAVQDSSLYGSMTKDDNHYDHSPAHCRKKRGKNGGFVFKLVQETKANEAK